MASPRCLMSARQRAMNDLIAQHVQAVDQLRRVAHYSDRAVMGRAMTDGEAETLGQRAQAAARALDLICRYGCSGFAEAQTRLRYLNAWLSGGNSLSNDQMRLLIVDTIRTNRAEASHAA